MNSLATMENNDQMAISREGIIRMARGRGRPYKLKLTISYPQTSG